MRVNLPVTDREVVLGEGETIVSQTDLQGRIIYVNRTFLVISGFAEEEVIGKAHNVVRHPDMPPAAFEDLWRTLKSGRPWSGMVKNRCKNGDYYWVWAEASPVVENGSVSGFLSVRMKPSRAQIDSAERLYKSMRDGTANNLSLSGGRLQRTGWLAKAVRCVADSSLKARLSGLIGLLSLLIAGVGLLGINGQSATDEGLRVVYEERTIPLTEIAEIRKRLLQNRLAITVALLTPETEVIRTNSDLVDRNIAEITALWTKFSDRRMEAEEKAVAEQFAADRKRFVKEGLLPAIAAMRGGDLAAANRIVVEKIRPLYEPVDTGINKLMSLQVEQASREYQSSRERFVTMRNESLAAIVLGILLATVLGIAMLRAMIRSLDRAESIAQAVARGDLTEIVEHSPCDETGRLIDALRIMMQALKGFESAQAEMITLHAAGELDHKIGAGQFQGSYRKMADQVNQLAASYIELNGRVVDVVQRYATGDLSVDMDRLPGQKARITAAVDAVKNSLAAISSQIDGLVTAAVRGDFTARGDAAQYQHDFRRMVEGLNQLMRTSDTGLQEVARVMQALARGDLTEKIDNHYEGTFGQLKDDANTTVEKLGEIIGEIKSATDVINTAAQEIASGNMDLSQRTEEQASSLEETSSSMEELTSTVKQNAENAQQANQLAQNASAIALQGGKVVGDVVQTMAEINESSKHIADIVGVIDGIAFQTNILALNAAVEAARAGEQGRGFAVVATEVRNLAQRSATAAKEIKSLINDSVEKVNSGSKLVDQAGKTMEEVVGSIQRVTSIMSEITAASREQSAGIEQVTSAVTQMDQVTQQNAALVEQSAAAAESMEEQARRLAASVGAFRLASEVGATSRPMARPAALAA